MLIDFFIFDLLIKWIKYSTECSLGIIDGKFVYNVYLGIHDIRKIKANRIGQEAKKIPASKIILVIFNEKKLLNYLNF